jgi:thioredoxin reductase
MGRSSPPRVAVIGGGPVGIEAALYAKSLGLPVTLYEQGQPGEFLGRWGFVRLFTPFGLNASPLGKRTLAKELHDLPPDTAFQTGREFRDSYLVPLANSAILKDCIRSQTSVVGVGRTGWRKTDTATGSLPPFRLLLRTASNAESVDTADAVLDCSGTFARPNWVGDGGIPAAGEYASRQHTPYWPEDVLGVKRNHYAGRSVIVVGGGHSAGTAVCDLMTLADEHQSGWVIWLTRGTRTQPLPRIPNDPLRERDRLAVRANTLATRCDGNLEHHPGVRIEEVVCPGPDKGFRVSVKVNGKPTTFEAERLIANVGYKPDLSLTAELRVGEPAGDFRTAEPGYYVFGAKSKGRDSGFLLRDSQEQIRGAFAEITGNARVNLYAA